MSLCPCTVLNDVYLFALILRAVLRCTYLYYYPHSLAEETSLLLAVPPFPRGSCGLELVVAAAFGLGTCSPFHPASPGSLYSGSLLAQPGLRALAFGEVKMGNRSEAALLCTESFITGLSLPPMLPVVTQSPPEPGRSHTTSALCKDSCRLPGFSPDLQWEVLHEALRDELRQAAGEGVPSLAGGPLFCASHTSVGGDR